MADTRTCETCGLAVPAETEVCPRDGTVLRGTSKPPGGAARSTMPAQLIISDLSSSPDSLTGLRIGEYELRQRIGVGGMGLVYDGIQPVIGKRVAVKVLRPELAAAPEQVARLLAEARAVNAIRHRGIIDIFGFGQVPDGRQYIVMEYLEGQALDAYMVEKHRLPVPEVLDILDEVLSALGAAHGAGVVHRDLKPSNIFLVRQPDGSRYVKLLDFGLAKQGLPAGRTAQTRTDMVVGTPEYMAPEQARGQPVGPMTDLYALGVVAFEMVTGRLPFIGSSPVDLLMKHVDARPPRPSEFIPELPPALDAFILQMLTKDPEARPGTAESLRRQLHRLRDTLVPAAPSPTALPPPEPPPGASPEEPKETRPTTLLPGTSPVPPEPSSAEMHAAGVRTPLRRLLPVGLGAAALLASSGLVLFLLREPASAPTTPPLPPPREVLAPPLPAEPSPGNAPETPDSATAEAPPEKPADTVSAVARAENPGSQPVSHKENPRPGSDAPTLVQLRGRVGRLEREIDRRTQAGTPPSPAARTMLLRLREDIEAAGSPNERREMSQKLSDWEKFFLSRP
jgi:serine/threonine protein kinase